MAKIDDAEKRLDAMFDASFSDANHPAMLDYVALKFELKQLRQERDEAERRANWQNWPNRNPASRGAYEFYINEEWMGIAAAAIDLDAQCCATLRKHRLDPDDERVRIRRVNDDDALLSDLHVLLAVARAATKLRVKIQWQNITENTTEYAWMTQALDALPESLKAEIEKK